MLAVLVATGAIACNDVVGLNDLDFQQQGDVAGSGDGANGASVNGTSGSGASGSGGSGSGASGSGAGASGSTSTGPFPMDCGNGMLEPSETCDDSNNNGGDGCAPDCQIEGVVDVCPGIEIELNPPGAWFVTTTVGNAMPSTVVCGAQYGQVLFRFVPGTATSANITVQGFYNKWVVKSDGGICPPVTTSSCLGGVGDQSINLDPSVSTYVVVASDEIDKGPVSLHITAQ